MAHYGAGKFAQTTAFKDPSSIKDPATAYTKAPLYWQGNIVAADGTQYAVTIRKGRGVDLARCFGLPYQPIMSPKDIRHYLDAISAYKSGGTEDAAFANIKAVRESSKRIAELERKIGEMATGDESELLKLTSEREKEVERNHELVRDHAKTWDAYISALREYNSAAPIFGLPTCKILDTTGVAA